MQIGIQVFFAIPVTLFGIEFFFSRRQGVDLHFYGPFKNRVLLTVAAGGWSWSLGTCLRMLKVQLNLHFFVISKIAFNGYQTLSR